MILVTGCAGFIGFHLTKKLLEKNLKIFGVDSIENYYSKELKFIRLNILKKSKKFTFKKIDLKNFSKLSDFVKKKKLILLFILQLNLV